MNNHGGNIFRIIDGPNRQPELEDYFETVQNLTAERTAADAEMNYQIVEDLKKLEVALLNFYKFSEKSRLLEIETDGKIECRSF